MITYKNGNLLSSQCDIICHQVNCQGVMGAGIAKQIRALYPFVYTSYKAFCDEYGCNFVFGHTLLCPIGNNRYVANMYAQYDYKPRNVRHTSYEEFRRCCKLLKELAIDHFPDRPVTIGFPDHIGCGLAGGNWSIVKGIIEEEFVDEVWNVEIWKL